MKVLATLGLLALFVAYSMRHLTQLSHESYEKIDDDVPHFVNERGMGVHWRRVGGTVESPRAVMIMVHGFGEHLGYYEDIGTTYNRQGWVCYGVDHVGHGLSEGEREYVESAYHLRDDVLYLVENIVKPKHPGLPIFIHGHSLGGLITILTVHKAPALFKATYLEAPLVEAHPSTGGPFLKKLAKALSFLPKLRVPGTALKLHLFTRNESMLERWANDELRGHFPISVGTGVRLMEAMEYLASIMENHEVTWPFLLATGDDDHGCDYAGGVKFFEAAKSPRKALKLYPGLRHALKWEPESDTIKKDAVDWFSSFLQ